jgi:hypothetical protein
MLERLAATGVWYPQLLDVRQEFLLDDALEQADTFILLACS